MDRKITAIKRQKKNPERLDIFLDGDYAFGLSRFTAAWLEIGQVLSDQKIERLLAEDEIERAYQKSLKFLSYRVRSEKEIRKKLEESEIDASIIDEVIARLRNKQYVKDEDFARQWVESRNVFRPRGKRALVLELRQKGIDEALIQRTVDDLVDEGEMAYQLGLRFSNRYGHLEQSDFRKKLISYLYRRGFSYETIIPIVDRIWGEVQRDKSKRFNLRDKEEKQNELT